MLGRCSACPSCPSNKSLAYELAFTGRDFSGRFADEKLGWATAVKDDGRVASMNEPVGHKKIANVRETEAFKKAVTIAKEITQNSPLAIVGTKKTLSHSLDHTVQEGLDYVRTLNAGLLQGEDTMKAAAAVMTKSKAQFSKL